MCSGKLNEELWQNFNHISIHVHVVEEKKRGKRLLFLCKSVSEDIKIGFSTLVCNQSRRRMVPYSQPDVKVLSSKEKEKGELIMEPENMTVKEKGQCNHDRDYHGANGFWISWIIMIIMMIHKTYLPFFKSIESLGEPNKSFCMFFDVI